MPRNLNIPAKEEDPYQLLRLDRKIASDEGWEASRQERLWERTHKRDRSKLMQELADLFDPENDS